MLTNTTTLISTLLSENDDVLQKQREPIYLETSDETPPTLLEIMITTQMEAQQEKIVTNKIQEKTFGGGFKKGFMSKALKNKKSSISQTDLNSLLLQTTSISSSSYLSSHQSDIITITTSVGTHAPIIEEVQSAMIADDGPFLRHLKKGGTYMIIKSAP
jgi:hypothetical protein